MTSTNSKSVSLVPNLVKRSLGLSNRLLLHSERRPCAPVGLGYSPTWEDNEDKTLEVVIKDVKSDDFIPVTCQSSFTDINGNDLPEPEMHQSLDNKLLKSVSKRLHHDQPLCKRYSFKKVVRPTHSESTIFPMLYERDLLKQNRIGLPNRCDKIFCSQWISNHQVVFGTKCHQLFLVDSNNNSCFSIFESSSSPLPDETDTPVGIRTMTLSPSGRLLATCGNAPNEVALYVVPSMIPVARGIIDAHPDTLFGMCWLSDILLAVVCRGGVLTIWHVDENFLLNKLDSTIMLHYQNNLDVTIFRNEILEQSHQIEPIFREYSDKGSLRDIAHDRLTNKLLLLTLDSSLIFVDYVTSKVVSTAHVRGHSNNTCLTYDDHMKLGAVGSHKSIHLIDQRLPQKVMEVPILDSLDIYIRSLHINKHLLSVGNSTCSGVKFFDLRRAKDWSEDFGNSSCNVVLEPDNVDADIHTQSQTTVFTHSFDSTHTQLFAAGGPLSSYNNGSFACIFK